MTTLRTQVAIVGAGPAGLLLAHLLRQSGIDCIVLERQTRAHIEGRIRAGVLEQGTVDTLTQAGLANRLHSEGLPHEGFEIAFNNERHRIDLKTLSGGKVVTVYGQHECVRDMIASLADAGAALEFEATVNNIRDIDSPKPRLQYEQHGELTEVECDYIAGCDGFHGISRQSVPATRRREFERVYPFGWLGVLAKARPASHELIYTLHQRGFSLLSMRSPELCRYYLQCEPDEDLKEWPDDRVWEELHLRNSIEGSDWRLNEGPIVEKNVTSMRAFVVEPMRFGNMFLAGDSAHIVPPTGAKGMNLAVADVRVLHAGLAEFYRDGSTHWLDRYSESCLRRIWKVQRFSWWMTSLLHRFPDAGAYDQRVQIAELEYLTSSESASRSLAENYTGLPFDI